MFTGDFLFPAMHKAGFASQPDCRTRQDALQLMYAYFTVEGRCAPPDNKPLPEELANCRPYLERELVALKKSFVSRICG